MLVGMLTIRMGEEAPKVHRDKDETAASVRPSAGRSVGGRPKERKKERMCVCVCVEAVCRRI